MIHLKDLNMCQIIEKYTRKKSFYIMGGVILNLGEKDKTKAVKTAAKKKINRLGIFDRKLTTHEQQV